VDAVLAGAAQPFERLVLVVPPVVLPAPGAPPPDRRALLALADALEARDPAAAATALRDQQPAVVRRLPAVGLWARRRAQEVAGPVLSPVVRAFAAAAPLDGLDADRAADLLAAVDVPVLVVGQEGDDVHPVAAARDLAAALPRAELEVVPAGGVLWTGRDRLRDLVAGFLGTSE
jgi:pimeloyl-ACP methyl ester carboxylesterase